MDSSPPGSSVHRILQARVLEWVTISLSKGKLEEEKIVSRNIQAEECMLYLANSNRM